MSYGDCQVLFFFSLFHIILALVQYFLISYVNDRIFLFACFAFFFSRLASVCMLAPSLIAEFTGQLVKQKYTIFFLLNCK